MAPNSEEVLSAFAQVSLAARTPVSAILTLESLTRIYPSVVQYHYLLGVALMQVGDMPAAVNSLQQAERLEPNRVLTLVALGLDAEQRVVIDHVTLRDELQRRGELDEAGGILSMRYCKGLVMTACVDAMDFYSPIFTREVVTFKAGLNHVGSSSLEIGIKVLAEVPWSGELRHACTAFLTYVHLGADLRPRPCPPFAPETAGERERWQAALARRERRLERVKRLKAAVSSERG